MSGTVTISDQRSYSKIETLHDNYPTEIHGALGEICGEFKVDRIADSRLANRFCDGCVSIDNDQDGREHQLMKEV